MRDDLINSIQLLVVSCCHIAAYVLVKIVSGNGVSPFDIKYLPEHMLTFLNWLVGQIVRKVNLLIFFYGM